MEKNKYIASRSVHKSCTFVNRKTKTVQTTATKTTTTNDENFSTHIQWKLSSGSFVLNVHSCHLSYRLYKLAVRCLSACVRVLELCVCINRKNPGRSSSDSINENESGNFEWSPLQYASKQTTNSKHTHTKKMSTHMKLLGKCVRVFSSVAAEARLIRAWARMLCFATVAAGKVRLAC